jgi:hypothetical protein
MYQPMKSVASKMSSRRPRPWERWYSSQVPSSAWL